MWRKLNKHLGLPWTLQGEKAEIFEFPNQEKSYRVYLTLSDFLTLSCINSLTSPAVLLWPIHDQPRSYALSPLPSLVVGRKTLIPAEHMPTLNLGGK